MPDQVFPRTVLTSGRLRMRPLEPDDAIDVHAAWQDEQFVRTAPVGYRYARAEILTAIEWCATTEERRLDGRTVEFAVVPREGGRLLGHVALFGFDRVARVAEIHYWTAPWARGHGYAPEASRTVAEWALREMAYERIVLQAATGNTASRRVAVGAGFRFEGVLRSAVPARDGGRTDLAVHSLVRADLATAVPGAMRVDPAPAGADALRADRNAEARDAARVDLGAPVPRGGGVGAAGGGAGSAEEGGVVAGGGEQAGGAVVAGGEDQPQQ